ncbi:MAG: hypothetical protein K8F25_15580 [Fimbriimonadaceae bacterium]|nr:hypothetical protein [Alphaproteobacteria bacterium]
MNLAFSGQITLMTKIEIDRFPSNKQMARNWLRPEVLKTLLRTNNEPIYSLQGVRKQSYGAAIKYFILKCVFFLGVFVNAC